MNGDNINYVNPNIPNTHYSISNLERAEKLKYAFSHDKYNPLTRKIVKNFFNLEHFSDVETLLKEDKHIYELAYNTNRKLYFDFDDLNYTTDEATHFINTFAERISTELNIIINQASLIVLKNDKYDKSGHPTDMIHSLHIIFSDFKMETKEMWDLAKYMNHTYAMDIDVNVYKQKQQFRLWKQSKMSKKIRLVNFYEGCVFPLRKSLINHTDKCKMTTFNKSVSIEDFYTKLDDGKKTIQLPKEKLFELIINGNVDAKQPQTPREKTYDGALQTEQITLNQKSFFHEKNANDWKTITMLLIKYPHLYSLERWNRESVRLSNNPKYTYETNVEYCSKINKDEVKSGYTKLFKLVSSYCVFHNIYDAMDYMKDYVRDFLKKYYDMETIRQIAENIVKYQTTEKIRNGKVLLIRFNYKYKTIDDKKSIVNVKNGFIYIENDTNTIVNMYNDNLPPKYESMFHQLNNIDEASEEAIVFLTNRKKVFTLLSRWGTGKTHRIIRLLLKDYKNEDNTKPKILVITESNSLNNKLIEDFKAYNFVSHLNAQKDITIDLKRCNNVICSIQSINKVGNHYDLIIIDEYESVCSSYSATTTFKGTTPNIAFNTLLNLIKTSKKTLVCDADISEDKIELLEQVVGRNEMMIYKNNQSAFAGWNINILTDKQHFTSLLITSVFIENKKIAVASATRVYVEMLFDEIVDMYKDDNPTPIKKIMRVDINGVKVYHGATEVKIDKTKDDILKDIEAFIIEQQIDLFLYSPTIKTGLSINNKYFNQTFGYTSSYSVLFNEMIQMLFRNRQLYDNKIILCIDERDFICGVNKPLSFIKDHQHIKTTLFKQLIATKQSEIDNVKIYKQSDCSDEYYQLQTINNRNKWNSKYNYVSNLIQLLQYHNLNYEYITNKTYDIVECEFDINVDEALETLKEKKLNEWIKTELLEYDDFIDRKSKPPHLKHLTNTPNNEVGVYSEKIKNSYNKTYAIFTIFKVQYLVDEYKDEITERSPYTPFTSLMTNEQSDKIINHHIRGYNNELFYSIFIKDKKINNIKEIFRLFNDKKADLTHTDKDIMMIDILTTEKIIAMFEIYDIETRIFKERTITNKEFVKILTSDIPLINAVYNDAVHKSNITFDVNNKQHVKAIYHYIKYLFQIVDICVKYVDENNTSRPTDKIQIYNPTSFFKYKTDPICSKTLDHLTDYSKPITLTINKEDVYSESETIKILKRKKNSNKDLIKLQKSLLYYETDSVDCENVATIITPPIEWGKVKNYEAVINKDTDYEVKILIGDNRIFNINDTFYNPLLNMKTIDDNSVMICDKQYKIHNKKNGRLCIVMDKKTHKTETLYKNNYGKHRPYNAIIPTINTSPNPYYEETLQRQTEKSNEECCECEEEEQMSYYKNDIQQIIKDFCCEYPMCNKAKQFITENEEPYLYYTSLLKINEPLINEIKNIRIISVG